MVALRRELAALFPDSIRGHELGAPEEADPLFEEELASLARAVPKRRNEFAMGRTAARRALASLGMAPVALLPNEDRSVAWPDRVWGSITHADGLCAAVVGLRSDLLGIGIDVEVKDRVEPKLWRMIATEPEQAYLAQETDVATQLERAALLFSAKESFYKAQYCVTRAWVGFHDAETAFERPGEFSLRLLKEVPGHFSAGTQFLGRYAVLARHVVTGLVILPR
jgi:4'-phosphopantetheinyl transferase EntD